jgi:hypothetical protein
MERPLARKPRAGFRSDDACATRFCVDLKKTGGNSYSRKWLRAYPAGSCLKGSECCVKLQDEHGCMTSDDSTVCLLNAVITLHFFRQVSAGLGPNDTQHTPRSTGHGTAD